MKSKTLKITNQNKLPDNLIESEVIDEDTYSHFKSLLQTSKNLCKGKTLKGKPYKVHVAIHNTYTALLKSKHHKIIYIHDNKQIFAYISVKLYYKDGNFLFIHKICSSMSGIGSYLMNKIIKYAKTNANKLNITYLSLTTHNLDLIKYYNKFKPFRVVEINSPQSKKKIPNRVAYIMWKLSENMPIYNYT